MNAPKNKTIVVSGAFEDPLDVRSNEQISPVIKRKQARELLCASCSKCNKSRVTMYCNDTNILISGLSNFEKWQNKEVYMYRSNTIYAN